MNINKTLLAACLLSLPVTMSFTGSRAVDGIQITGVVNEPVYADADLETIRARIIQDLLEPMVKEAVIADLMRTQKPDGTWPGINYEDVSRTGFEHRIHLENMLTLSRSFRKKGSPYFQSQPVKATLSKALDFWLKKDFICENWWWNEMGTPHLMINIMLLMDADLTAVQRTAGLKIAGRANLEAFGARPGGDLLPIAGMLGKQALFTRNTEVLERVVKVMASEIQVTTGRGIKPDLSFHHRTDNVISTLTYGTSFANSFAYWAVKISGTRFKLPADAVKLLIDYYIDGISRSMVHGIYADPGAQNRDMTRINGKGAAGTDLPENLLKVTDYRSSELKQLIALRKGMVKPSAKTNKFFWHSSYLVHERPSWFASVRMHSSRGNNMEEPYNEEGLKNHHFGDGSNFILRKGDEYFNIYPVWNWLMIPGTTVLQNKDVPHWKEVAKKGKSSFSGGASDGKSGLAAIDLISVHDPLKAKKSWFFFDDEYVCLGAGIQADSDLPVFTTLNQTLLKSDVIASAGGKKTSLSTGKHILNEVSWVLQDSVAYLFPEPVKLGVANQAATGNWRQINHQSWATTDRVEKDVFNVWIDHGTRPSNSGYAYVVVPAVAAGVLDGYMASSGIQIVSNTESLQAVTHGHQGITGMVFYQPGRSQHAGLSVQAEQPCLVMVKGKGSTPVSITVTDPTQTLKTISIRLGARVISKTPVAKSTWDEKSNSTIIEITMPSEGLAGQSVTVTF